MDPVFWREESELGSWTQAVCRPGALAGFVQSVWLFDGKLEQRQRLYPTGELDLIVQLDAPFRVVEGQPPGACPTSCLTGMLVAPLVIDTPAKSRLLGVRLRPAGAFALFGIPQYEVTGAAVDLHDIIGNEARRLTERLDEAGSDVERLRLLVRWITQRLADHTSTDPAVAYAVSEIESTGGKVPIGKIVERVGASPKRFTSLFEQQVGVKPKLFSRIIRFRELAAALPGTADPLSETALKHGYYDHSHMNLEFREFAGMSPSQFLTATPYPESLAQALAD
ncbi:helix-turn-helix domain-containing protein [Kribbella sp. NPDC023855]|uniref:helix-turn-helix domain-containing protein n=1 Tax=Kribbella sp. NPDC023855 TaxID=3154698 RepID=UPI0033D9C570